MIPPFLFFILYPISAIVTIVLAIFGWYNRKNSISQPFILLMVATSIWTTGDWLNTLTADPILNYLINSTIYPAVVTVPIAWFLVSLYYTGYDQYLTRTRVAALFIVPAIAVFLVITNPFHHLYYPLVVPEMVGNLVFWHYYHGTFFYIVLVYLYLLPAIAFVLILNLLFGPTAIYRRQTFLLFLAAFIPFSSDLLYVLYPGFYPTIDYTPFSFTIVGILIAFGIVRYQLFSSVPLAYASVFSSMHDGVFVTDSSFHLIDLNPAAIHICGRSSRDAIGSSVCEIMPAIGIPDDDNTSRCGVKRERRQEIEIIGKTGSVWYEVSDFPLSSGNRSTGWIFTVRDISRRKQIEQKYKESQERLRLAIDGSHIGIWEYHVLTKTLDLSSSLGEILGYGSELKTRDSLEIADYLIPEDRNLFISFLNENLRKYGVFFESDLRMQCRDGSWRWIYVRGKVVEFDKAEHPLLVIGTSLDISDRRNTQESLEIANKKLSLLSSITRHDILNQVTGLQGYLEFSLEEILDGPVHRYLKLCEGITHTIHDQIEFTRIYEEIGVHSPTWQNLNLIIKKVQRDLPNTTIRYHVSFDNLMIYADPLLEKVIYTLIENTIRHGESVTDVWFRYEIVDSDLIFQYEDNGIGVEEGDKTRIFIKNFGKNTGFGLFIAKEILAITGITIQEKGVPGKGVIFNMVVTAGNYRFVRRTDI